MKVVKRKILDASEKATYHLDYIELFERSEESKKKMDQLFERFDNDESIMSIKNSVVVLFESWLIRELACVNILQVISLFSADYILDKAIEYQENEIFNGNIVKDYLDDVYELYTRFNNMLDEEDYDDENIYEDDIDMMDSDDIDLDEFDFDFNDFLDDEYDDYDYDDESEEDFDFSNICDETVYDEDYVTEDKDKSENRKLQKKANN